MEIGSLQLADWYSPECVTSSHSLTDEILPEYSLWSLHFPDVFSLESSSCLFLSRNWFHLLYSRKLQGSICIPFLWTMAYELSPGNKLTNFHCLTMLLLHSPVSHRSSSFIAWCPMSWSIVTLFFSSFLVLSSRKINLVLFIPFWLEAESTMYLISFFFIVNRLFKENFEV